MKVLAVILFMVGGGLLYLTLVKGQNLTTVFQTAKSFFSPSGRPSSPASSNNTMHYGGR